MYPVTITFVINNAAELLALANASGAPAPVEISTTVSNPAPGKASTSKPQTELKPGPTPAESAASAPTPANDVAADRKAVSELAVNLVAKFQKRDQVVSILAEHGAKSVKELADEHLTTVHAKLKAIPV